MTILKRWESPRKPGRNHKGRGGAARQRQIRKRNQQLRQRLKTNQSKPSQTGEVNDLPCLLQLD